MQLLLLCYLNLESILMTFIPFITRTWFLVNGKHTSGLMHYTCALLPNTIS